jgi:hypothetical protein
MTSTKDFSLTQPGSFVIGANYWASHAGTAMWTDWQPEVVERDFERLHNAGLHVLRVFPLWPDFQPLTILRGGHGRPVEFRHGEATLADSPAGRAGLSDVMLQRFSDFADLAQRYDLKLIVGLLTGWMSGRLFVPPAFNGINVLTDPVAMQWEVRFVTQFVRRFKDHAAIAAWDLGNECNCMAPATAEQAWLWTATIVNAIRAADGQRPIVSGMHSLPVDPLKPWAIQDQAELTDVLTTHPYPVFTPHCDQDPINTMRTLLHATAESRLYADVGGKPCLCEEIGTLGPMIASEAIARDFARSSLFSLWANDCHGLLWWCANDQAHLEHAPYDWHTVERELGLFRRDGQAKPVVSALTDFRALLDRLPFAQLPPPTKQAVCILSDHQDHWGVAFSAYVLAKQAGFDIEFQYETQPLKDAPLYLLPCASGHRVVNRRRWLELLGRVAAGATLYISNDDGLFSGLADFTGIEVQTRQRRTAPAQVTFSGLSSQPAFPLSSPFRLTMEAPMAEVLATEADGNPALTWTLYGKGNVYFLAFPMEQQIATSPGAFYGPDSQSYWHVYRHIAGAALSSRLVSKMSQMVGITEHPLDEKTRAIVAINYSPQPVTDLLALADGWEIAETLHGETPSKMGSRHATTVPANDAVVFVLRRSSPAA